MSPSGTTRLRVGLHKNSMRIYISVATQNIKENLTSADKIHTLVQKYGHTHTASWNVAFYEGQQNFPEERNSDLRVKNEILRSDLMIAEISIPSFGVGYFVCLAQMYQVPVVCLYHSKYKDNVSAFLKTFSANNFLVLEYDDSNLEQVFCTAVEKSTPKKVRFNFNLRQKSYRYLNVLAKEGHKTKTKVINDIIIEKVEGEKIPKKRSSVNPKKPAKERPPSLWED